VVLGRHPVVSDANGRVNFASKGNWLARVVGRLADATFISAAGPCLQLLIARSHQPSWRLDEVRVGAGQGDIELGSAAMSGRSSEDVLAVELGHGRYCPLI
jgi:hypothetical protein